MLDFNEVHEKMTAAETERQAAINVAHQARDAAYEALREREGEFYEQKIRIDATYEAVCTAINQRYRAAVDAATAES